MFPAFKDLAENEKKVGGDDPCFSCVSEAEGQG